MANEEFSQSWLDRLRRLMSPASDNPELLKAQCAALSRLIPLMYFILVANSWVLAASFIDTAPIWLTVYASMLLTVICVVRLAVWWRMRSLVPTTEQAIREQKRTNFFSTVLAVAFPIWAFALFPYGDAYAQSHVAFFLAISMIGSMCCLIHMRSAALNIAIISGIIFVTFFAMTGKPTFIAVAINVLLVMVAIVIVIVIQSRDFARMVNAQTEARKREQEQSRLLHMIDDMPVAVMTVDPATLNINYVNDTSKRTLKRIEHLLPIKVDDIVGTSIDIFHKHPAHQRKLLADPANLPHRARIKLGPEVLDLQVSAVNSNDGSYIGPMLSWAIVTKEVEAENRIYQLAHYDTLTGLPNRNTFNQQLEAALALPGRAAALLFIDLDGFKIVNDSRGHSVGDILLKQVADRLRAACGEPGMRVGRLAGDEFAVFLHGSDADRATWLAGTLIDALSASYVIDASRTVRIGASIGIALAPAHGTNAETLLSRADMALYAAKAAGKGTFELFAPEIEHKIQERVLLEAKLREALEREEGLFVFYQPIVDIQTGKVTAREALVRWHHPKRGWIPPSEFVPIAEQSGLIDQLGRLVLYRACRDAAGWDDDVRVAVNVSAGQLGKGTLASTVLAALVEAGLPPDRLEIEITETALVNAEADGLGDLRRLRDMGLRIALDDFGTGYSSLAHLRTFTFDKIKIDASFVHDAVHRSDCAAVVRAVAELGRRLGVVTVAEGVETQAHLDCVAAEGCSEIQGYFIGHPLPSSRDVSAVSELGLVVSETTVVYAREYAISL